MIENLRLRGAFTLRHFRFIVISVFYPFLASFVDQRTLVCTPQPSKNGSDDNKGQRIGNLRLHAALTWRDFRFIVISSFYPFLL